MPNMTALRERITDANYTVHGIDDTMNTANMGKVKEALVEIVEILEAIATFLEKVKT